MQFMTKLSRKPLPREDWEEFFDQICIALTMCETKQEVREFLNDLWTYTEKKMFSKRLQVARELLEDQTYDAISRRYKVTESMIASVSGVLNSMGNGFGKAHEKLFKLEQQKQDRLAKIIKEAENPVKLRHREVLSEAFESGINLISSKLKRRKKAKSVIV